jgi:hypothetical protein
VILYPANRFVAIFFKAGKKEEVIAQETRCKEIFCNRLLLKLCKWKKVDSNPSLDVSGCKLSW